MSRRNESRAWADYHLCLGFSVTYFNQAIALIVALWPPFFVLIMGDYATLVNMYGVRRLWR